jgi:trk system potassium uptake protein TrkA
VALTNLDEENILLSLYAKSQGTKKQVTKINRIDFDDVIRRLDLDSIVCPKNVTADAIVRYVRAMKRSIGSKVEALYNVIQDEVEASEFTVTEPSRITGVPLSQLKFKENVLVASLLRNGTVLIPRGNDTIEPGDSVIIVSKIMGLSDITDVLR